MQEEEESQDRPSKTQLKQRMHELQALGARLVELSPEQLDSMNLPEFLRDALQETQRTSGRESRRRQLQYVGRLMREVDPEPIREKLAVWDGQSRGHTARVHLAERWRERLLEDEAALAELTALRPGLDIQRLRNLIRNARAERDAGKPPKSFRELFRALMEQLGPAEDGKTGADPISDRP